MQPNAEQPVPRHRSDQPVIVFTSDPPDPRGHPAVPADRGIGFRSNREVRAEMSPVIYRPAGSSDHEPERPARVSIAGPGIPTAASFVGDTPQKPSAEPTPVLDDDLDEDPEIDDDELAGEAADDLVDGGPGDEPHAGPFLGEQDLYGDDASDDLADEVPPPAAAAARPTDQRRPPLQRRRRRLLGWGSEPAHEPEPEPDTTQESGSDSEPEALRSPAEPPPVAPSPSDADQTDEHDHASTHDHESTDDQDQPERALTRPRRVRTLHMTAPPVGPADDGLIGDGLAEAEPTADTTVVDDPRWRQAAPPRFDGPARQVEESTATTDDDAAAVRDSVAISGHVISTRGRGLSGVSVVVVDADDQVVGTTITGRRGQYLLADLPPGSYRLGARDTIDGDFTDSWHGGDDAASATVLEQADDGTIRDIVVTLTGRVAIDADVDVRRKKIRVEVDVIDRTTGLPGEGSVTVSTDLFSTRLPLTEGRANITVFTLPGERDAPDRKKVRRLRIEYPGSRHTGPATRTIRLR